MQKKTPDYDNVFKTMKMKHKRLFISVINDIFKKDYPMDTKVEILPSEGYLTESETVDGTKEIEEQISDFLIKIGSEVYLLECQSYDDGSMAIRIAEYAFIVARQFATWDIGHVTIPMPRFSVIYVKRTEKTPKTTKVTFTFPDGQIVNYESANVILEELTKEYIVERRLYPYIPFYIARYEKDIVSEDSIEDVVGDLVYFRNEERLVNIMGGTVLETKSEQLIHQGEAKMLIELGREDGLDDATILKRMQDKIGLPLERATAYLEKYGKRLV